MTITGRFVALIAMAAIVPLVLYGAVSVNSLRDGTKASVIAGNEKVATQVAEQIAQYMNNNVRVLQSVGAELDGTYLAPWQQDRILKDHVLAFHEFREISLFDANARLLATSSLLNRQRGVPDEARRLSSNVYVAPVRMDDDLLPTTTIAVRLKRLGEESGWIVGEIALEDLWRMVDSIRLGTGGYALVVSQDGYLIAHGNPDDKRRIAVPEQKSSSGELTFAAQVMKGGARVAGYADEDGGIAMMAVASPIIDTGWIVIVEQPEHEAYAVMYKLERQLAGAIGLALLVTGAAGYFGGRSFIQRIFALTRVTRAIADGKLDTRVAPDGKDEIRELGDAFNSMADRLVELQNDVRKQERQAMFGRIAAGLVHDLSHPIQNIGNSCKLILKMGDDAEYRETFRRTVEREMVIVKRVLDDLQNVAKPIPLERFPVELSKSLNDAVEAMLPHAETAGVGLSGELFPEPLYIEGDVFALARVYRNLILNAIQATAPGGRVIAATEPHGDRVRVRVTDTGCGIAADRLGQIFEDFVTTKRRGLGLGLAISKKIVEQLGGTISVTSEMGKGTTFVIEFPRTAARPAATAASELTQPGAKITGQ